MERKEKNKGGESRAIGLYDKKCFFGDGINPRSRIGIYDTWERGKKNPPPPSLKISVAKRSFFAGCRKICLY